VFIDETGHGSIGPMDDLERQIPAGKVHLAFTMSLDGFVAGPGHDMSFMANSGAKNRDGLLEEYVEATGAVLAGRDGFDSAIGDSRPYGGAWSGPIFVLTHHPDDARHDDDVTILSCPLPEAVQIGLDAAKGKNLQVLSASIGTQLLQLGLVDELDIHIAPVLLGDGIRLYDVPGGHLLRLQRQGADSALAAHVRYRPA
jgi:dihydrofolate reductase